MKVSTKKRFNFATDLIRQRNDMLKDKDDCLYELYDLCTNDEQRALVRQLILDFNEMNDDVYNLCLIEMSKYILSSGYPMQECMVAAMAHDHLADSSQGVLNDIKVHLGLNNFPANNYCNRADQCKKKIKNSPICHFFIVDDFIGSGTTVLSRIQTFRQQFGQQPYTLSFVVAAGMQETVDSLKAAGVNVYCAYTMDKAISGKGTQDDISKKLELMSDIEAKLAAVVNKTNLADYHLGYKQTETLFCRKYRNCPNNTFPIFWWKTDYHGNERKTIYSRIQEDY